MQLVSAPVAFFKRSVCPDKSSTLLVHPLSFLPSFCLSFPRQDHPSLAFLLLLPSVLLSFLSLHKKRLRRIHVCCLLSNQSPASKQKPRHEQLPLQSSTSFYTMANDRDLCCYCVPLRFTVGLLSLIYLAITAATTYQKYSANDSGTIHLFLDNGISLSSSYYWMETNLVYAYLTTSR